MRLPKPFVRLPIRVDDAALVAEIDPIDPAEWRRHPEGAPGNTALPLVSVEGDPDDDGIRGRMMPTPNLRLLPYTVRVLAALESVIGRTRLMRIDEESELALHVDTNYYWWNHLRVHIPVSTSPDVAFECGATTVHMAAGEVWVFDTWRPHRVHNPAESPRTHLVVDTVGSASLWRMIDDQAQPERFVDPAAGSTAAIVTEMVNHPAVMHPHELSGNIDAIVDELRRTDQDAADRLEATMRPVQQSWRETWALHGDRPVGRRAFVALRDEADRLLAGAVGHARLPNDINAGEAVRQLVLRPSVDPAVTGTPTPSPAPTTSPATRTAPITIDRPIFVVSAPRAGSSMLFEALARAPTLFTVGGESHRVIEAIPYLHPAAHDWDSNRLDATDATPDVVHTLRQSFTAELRDGNGARPHGVTRMLEKTPKNALRVPFLAAAFPDATFVYLYRDPRETVSSMLDAWRSGRFVTYPHLPGWEGPPWSLLLTPGWRELGGAPLAEVVTRQWATTTAMLLDDLDALSADRWCVASYDRLVADPQGEIQRIAEYVDVALDVSLPSELPPSRHTLDSPHPEKWRRNADELEPAWDLARDVAVRAHAIFAAPPRIKPVHSQSHTSSAPVTSASNHDFRSVFVGSLPEVLDSTHCSLLVSTYQSGRVIVVRSDGVSINTHFRGFLSPMGMARRGPELAIGTKNEVQVFRDQPAVAAKLEPPGRHDACFVPRRVHTTGDIRVHDLAFAGDELWLVNTRFSCLATLDERYSFVPRWRPPFVTALAPQDRCHLNGLAVVDETPRFVTALGATDELDGWRDDKLHGGVVVDIESGAIVADGLCMPHSPRWYDGRLWVLESGRGAIGVVDLESGRVEEVARLPGFTRGLAFAGPFAFVGLSQVREHVFDGLPLESHERQCGVAAVDVRSGTIVANLRFEGVVEEIFDVTVLAGLHYPEIAEPGAELIDGAFVLPDAALADVPPEMTG